MSGDPALHDARYGMIEGVSGVAELWRRHCGPFATVWVRAAVAVVAGVHLTAGYAAHPRHDAAVLAGRVLLAIALVIALTANYFRQRARIGERRRD